VVEVCPNSQTIYRIIFSDRKY